ncbi:hypothetical protein [Streptomyces antimicrobicus]|uniref:Uncharacterized protein n=1 Tax=Streptomyces antimicrobicus TaxID=2883108 RepID=A0ABS8B116_9ACTN|nr:hypothetical protein [Streptomyces antimicrobicus]MCB5178306.1 hypothetical protein [Streptomyces antimicrobicus]
MTTATKRMVVSGGSAVAGAVVNVTTGMLTQKWALAWVLCTVVAVAVAAVLTVWLARLDGAAEAVASAPAPAPVRRQELTDLEVEGGSLTQRLPGPGEQVVRRTTVRGDVTQEQTG